MKADTMSGRCERPNERISPRIGNTNITVFDKKRFEEGGDTKRSLLVERFSKRELGRRVFA